MQGFRADRRVWVSGFRVRFEVHGLGFRVHWVAVQELELTYSNGNILVS